MTCIAALVHEGAVYMAGDSAGVSGLDLMVRADRKVFKKDGFVIGFTTSFRMGQILRYVLSLPKRHADTDVMEFMVTDFVGALRSAFKDGGFARRQEEAEIGGQFLVGHAGRLFAIHGDYQVDEAACGYHAVGCGEGYAKGVLFATAGQEPHTRIATALRAAETHSGGVRGPFHSETLWEKE